MLCGVLNYIYLRMSWNIKMFVLKCLLIWEDIQMDLTIISVSYSFVLFEGFLEWFSWYVFFSKYMFP